MMQFFKKRVSQNSTDIPRAPLKMESKVRHVIKISGEDIEVIKSELAEAEEGLSLGVGKTVQITLSPSSVC